nr:beta-galactosidase 3 [Tanacetum cinerariifolium]
MLPTNTELFTWATYNKDSSMVDESSTFTLSGLLEQVNITCDNTDHLWYTTSVVVSSSESFLRKGEHPELLPTSSKMVQGFNYLRLHNMEDKYISNLGELLKLLQLKCLRQLYINKNNV